MSKTLPLVTLALLTACARAGPLPSARLHAGPEQAVQPYFQPPDTGSSRLLRSAFHPDVLMHWVDGADGTLRTRTQLEWWQALDADAKAPRPAARRGMTVLDREGPFALMEAVSHWPDRTFDDLLL